jgi:2-dehydropantoate 2-reductase
MRYIVIGAGAVGGVIGGLLHKSGREVVLVARGAHYEALRTEGLRLMRPDGTSHLPVAVVDGPQALEPREDDVLVLAVKTQDSEAALDAWSARGSELPLVCAQNGVENERLALRRFRQVYGMCVWMPSTYLQPGVVVAPSAPHAGILHIGRYPSGSDATAKLIAADLEASGMLAPVVADVMRWKYAKLLANLANALEAVCGQDDSADRRELLLRAVAEGEAVLAAAGIPYAGAAELAETRGDRLRPATVEGAQPGGGSSWQSLTRGTGSIEADFLNGEIVLLGRAHGVPTPVNEVLQRTANSFARERRRPGALTAGELAALVS